MADMKVDSGARERALEEARRRQQEAAREQARQQAEAEKQAKAQAPRPAQDASQIPSGKGPKSALALPGATTAWGGRPYQPVSGEPSLEDFAQARNQEAYGPQGMDSDHVWRSDLNPAMTRPVPTHEDLKQEPFASMPVPKAIMFLAENAHGRDPRWFTHDGLKSYADAYQKAYDARLQAHMAWTNEKGEHMGYEDAMRLAKADALQEVKMSMTDRWDVNRPHDQDAEGDAYKYTWAMGMSDAYKDAADGVFRRFKFDYGDDMLNKGAVEPWQRDDTSLADWKARWNDQNGPKWEKPGDYVPYQREKPFDPNAHFPGAVTDAAKEAFWRATQDNHLIAKMAGYYPDGNDKTVIPGMSLTMANAIGILGGLKASDQGEVYVRNPTLDCGAQWMIRQFRSPKAYAGYIRNRVSLAEEMLSKLPPEQDHRYVREAIEQSIASYKTLADQLDPQPAGQGKWDFLK